MGFAGTRERSEFSGYRERVFYKRSRAKETEASLLQTARSVLRTLEGKRNSPPCKMEKFGDGRDKSDSLRRGR